jgi:hypothetical protein
MKPIRPILTCGIVSFALAASITVCFGYGVTPPQQPKTPITKSRLISALIAGKKQGAKLSTYTSLITEYGVDFEMTEAHEKEIRKAATFLTRSEQDTLIATIRSSFVKPAKFDNLTNNSAPSAAEILSDGNKYEIRLPFYDEYPFYIPSLNLAVRVNSGLFQSASPQINNLDKLVDEEVDSYRALGNVPCIIYFTVSNDSKLDIISIRDNKYLNHCVDEPTTATDKGAVTRCRNAYIPINTSQDITMPGIGTLRVSITLGPDDKRVRVFPLNIERQKQ